MAIEGKLVILREEREDDLPHLVALRNDLDTQAWSRALPPDYTLDMYRKRHTGREFSFDRDEGRFIIVEKATGKFAGYLGYSGTESRMECTIGIMVAREFWGSGLAQDAQEVMLHFLFMELGLRVVRLWTHSGNVRAIGLAEKAGFKLAVRNREALFKDGRLLDNLVMDLLREEYFAAHPEVEDHLPLLPP